VTTFQDCVVVDSCPPPQFAQISSPSAGLPSTRRTFSLDNALRERFFPADTGTSQVRWFTAHRVPMTRVELSLYRSHATPPLVTNSATLSS
jgi:hypothetical protein